MGARQHNKAPASSAPLSFGLPADDIRARLAGSDAAPEIASRWFRLHLRYQRERNRWKAGLIVRLAPRLEKVIPWTLAQCPICEWHGLTFRPVFGPDWILPTAKCPGCEGLARHRLFALAFGQIPRDDQPLPTVWMAPEGCLRPMFARSAASLITVDLEMPEVDLHCDAEKMPFVTNSIGLLVSNDVLEHVPDDCGAMAEVKRVLAEGATALIHVPILATETVEYGFANEGEYGHRRAYGPDVVARFEAAGLTVKPFRAVDLSPAERRRYGLARWDTVLQVT